MYSVLGALTVPDGNVVLLHELDFAVVHLSNVLFLVFMALETPYAIGETESAVVMDGVHRVGVGFVKPSKVHAETFPIVNHCDLNLLCK